MIGHSQVFRDFLGLVEKLARYDAHVLIEGETGTGKELAARAIHYHSRRSGRPFVPVNCGAIPDTLFESELFGHRRGAFTDAREDQPGLVGLAHTGTLFLDEVDALSPRAQVGLLRFLQDQQFRPLGAKSPEQADIRVLAASNTSLEDEAKAGRFRADLLYRLKLMHVRIPPLRERHGDADLLAGHFVRIASARFQKPATPIAASTRAWFDRYSWPGNIRELEHLVYRSFLLSDAAELAIDPPQGVCARPELPELLTYRQAKARAIEDFERHFLTNLMRRSSGSVSAAARLVNTDRRHLGRLLRRYAIEVHSQHD